LIARARLATLSPVAIAVAQPLDRERQNPSNNSSSKLHEASSPRSGACQRHQHKYESGPASWREAFSNKQNDSKRLSDDPVLKIKDPTPAKREKGKKARATDCAISRGRSRRCVCPVVKRKNRLSALAFTSKVRDVWLVSDAHYSRRLGH